MQFDKQPSVSVAFFGDATLGSGDLHETMHIAGTWSHTLIFACENKQCWEMLTAWSKTRKTRSLIPYAEPFGFAARSVDGNDALDLYHSARWARSVALSGRPVFLDCRTFRSGLYSSHFGEVRSGIEDDLAEAERRDPLRRMADWSIGHGVATAMDLEILTQEETFGEVFAEKSKE
jgi:TPP-dependent pyruvate/acetoin dehydrogenase alpha subunit